MSAAMATSSAPKPAQNACADIPSASQPTAGRAIDGSNSAASGMPGRQTATGSPQPSVLSHHTSNAPPLYEIASFQPVPNHADPTSGMLKDGRVRNPVPSKLKGKTDHKKGNFSVMHMELKGKDVAVERDAAAKRTSESTEMAAKMAFQNGYVSLRRSRFVHVPDDSGYHDSNQAGSHPGAPPPPQYPAHRRPLDSADIKAEQARLLTLLRSISPNLVVDQICKALAFFGGIPGAPPPVDGRFPESEKSNGSGALFVGWIAEIFPNLDGPAIPNPSSGPSAPVYHAPERHSFGEKRPRGRPKGSKASKFRSDKGVKKGPKRHLIDFTGGRSQEEGGDDSWIDVDDGPEDERLDGTPARSSNPFHSGDVTASGRKRGRPKGSKNRPKDGEERTSAPIATPIPESGLFSLGRKKGRPKGSKNKPREAAAQTSSDPVAAGEDDVSTTQPVTLDTAPAQIAAPPESTSSTSQPTSFQPVNAGVSNAQSTPGSNSPVNHSAQATKKRKRKGKDAEPAQNAAPANGPTTAQINGTLNNVNNASIGNRVSQTPIPVPVIPPIQAPPPAKRQRKSKEPKSTSAKNQAGTADIETTQVVSSTETADQPERYTSPTIEELEAQLEEHANASPPPAPIPAPRHQQLQQRSEQKQATSTRSQRQKQPQNASPNVNQLNTASPHLGSVQSVSPNLGHVHSASPNMSQQQASKSHTPNSLTPQPQQQQARTSQSFYSQSRNSQQQYSQQSPQQQQTTQAQQYSTQPQKSQFTQQAHQTYSAQQQPQYSTRQNKQQSYSSQQASQRYPSQQQQQYSTYATSSANSTPQTIAQQSPQFGATSTSSFTSGDGNFRAGSSTGMNYANSSFGSLRTTTASPSDNTYRGAANNYGSSARQPSSFGGSGGGRTPLPSSTSSHTPVQGGVQSLPSNLQGFQNFTDLSSFDMSNLDTSGSSGLGLNAASYNMGTGNVSRGPSNAGNYATSTMTNFDTNLGGNDRYYVGRR